MSVDVHGLVPEVARWEDWQCDEWGVVLVEGEDIRGHRQLRDVELMEAQLSEEPLGK